jgi:hypothetical protein
MSSRAKGSVSTEPHATSTQTVASVAEEARQEEIRIRAYQVYLERGEQPGRELDDWLQAELELGHGLLRDAQGV